LFANFGGAVDHKKVPLRVRDTIADTILATSRYLDLCSKSIGASPQRGKTSTTDQYRLNAADFLSLAGKPGDSCWVSHFIDMALYWFNMAERVERGAGIVLPRLPLSRGRIVRLSAPRLFGHEPTAFRFLF
jgi:hypothetical protein